MKKKELKQEIEKLTILVNELKKQKKELISKQFDEDITKVIDTLKKHGHLDWQINVDRHNFRPEIEIKRTYIFTLSI